MKRKFGIFLIIIFTVLTSGIVIYLSFLSLFLIVQEMPEEKARIVANEVLIQNLPFFLIAFVSLFVINYLILKKIIKAISPFRTTVILSIITFIILLILQLEFKRKFIEQNKIDFQRIQNM